jgi:hypothetical protein
MKKLISSLTLIFLLSAVSGTAWPAQPTPVARNSAKTGAHQKSKSKGMSKGKTPKKTVIPPSAQASSTPVPQPKKQWWHFW